MAIYPNSQSIVTLAECKALNNISVNTFDTWLNVTIPTVERSVEDYCRRRFCNYTFIQWVSMDREILTDNWPINNVLVIGNPHEIIKINDPSNSYNFSVLQPTSNNIAVDARLVVTNTSTFVTTEFLFSTYLTVDALKTAVESTVSGVTFTYQNNPTQVPFTTLNTLCLRPSNGKTLYAGVNYFDQSSNTSIGDIYRIGDNSDRLIFSPQYTSGSKSLYSGNYIGPYTTGYTNIDSGSYSFETYNNTDMMIVYNAGYSTSNMPSTLKWVVSSIVGDLMSIYDIQSSGVSKSIYRSETLGDYTYLLDTQATISGIIDRYASQLNLYKKKVI